MKATHDLVISNITIRGLLETLDEDKEVKLYLEFDVQGAKAKTGVAKVHGDAHDFTTSSVEAKHLSQDAPATLEVHAYRKRTLLPDHLIGSGAVQLTHPGSGQIATVNLKDKAGQPVGTVEFRVSGDAAGAAAGTGGVGTVPGVASSGTASGANPADPASTAASVGAANTAALSEAERNKQAAQETKADLAADKAKAKSDAVADEAAARADAVAAEATAKTNATADQAYGRTADTANAAQDKLQGWKEGLLEKQAESRDTHEHKGAESVPVGGTSSAYNSAIGIPPEAGHVSDAPGSSAVSNAPVGYEGGTMSGAVAPTGAGAVLPGSLATSGPAATNGSATGQGTTWSEKLRATAVGAIDKTAEALEAAKIHLTGREAGPATGAATAPSHVTGAAAGTTLLPKTT